MKKNKIVVILNPNIRTSHMLDFAQKYNFTPAILKVNLNFVKEIEDDIDNTIAQIKNRYPNLLLFDDKGDINYAYDLLSKYDVQALIPYEETVIYGDKLAKMLGCLGNDPATTEDRKNKYLLNEKISKNKLRAIKSLIFKNNNIDDIIKYFDNNFPLLIKPTYGSSSMYLYIINNKKELEKKLKMFKSLDKKILTSIGDIIIQEYIVGDEYVVNFCSYKNKHILTDMWDYEKKENNGKIIYHSTTLVKKLDKKHKQMADYCLKILKIMKHSYGPTHFEIKYDKKGPVLIECNLRMMGGIFLENEPTFNKYKIMELCLLSYFKNSPIALYFKKENEYNPGKNYIVEYTMCNSNSSYKINSIITTQELKKIFPTYQKSINHYVVGDTIPLTSDYIDFPAELEFSGANENKVNYDIKKFETEYDNKKITNYYKK